MEPVTRSSGASRPRPAPAVTGPPRTAADGSAGCAPPLRADARRNRDRILAAADAAFAEEGLGVPVDEIARRAGLGAGTLYRHFPTKEALFQAVLVAHMDRLACYGQQLAGSDRPDQALFEFVGHLASEAASKRNLIDALSGAGFDVKAASWESKVAVEEAFQALLSRAQAAGLVRDDVQVADLMGLVMGACALATSERVESPQSRMLAVVFAGLRAEPASPAVDLGSRRQAGCPPSAFLRFGGPRDPTRVRLRHWMVPSRSRYPDRGTTLEGGGTAMTGLTTGFQLSDQQAEMLAELKRYLDKTFPRERECDTSPEWSSDEEYQWCRQYNQQLFDDGWLVPHWPEKYGGRGLTPVDQMLIREEMAYRRVGICNANGLDMLGPYS